MARILDGTAAPSMEPQRPASVGALPRIEPRPYFDLYVRPNGWTVQIDEQGPVLRPEWAPLEHKGGFNGSTASRAGLGLEPAIVKFQSRGMKLIPHDWKGEAFGAKMSDYVSAYQGFKGPVHCMAWQRPLISGGRVAWDWDPAAFRSFVSFVVKQTGPCPAPILKLLLSDAERAQALAFANDRSPHAHTNAQAAGLQVEFLTKLLEARKGANKEI